MKYYIEFVTTPTADTPGTTLLVHFDDKRYLLGHVSEGLQRAFVQRGLRMANLSDMFVAGKTSWTNNGGLLGTLLTIAEATTNATSSQLDIMMGKKFKLERLATEAKTSAEAEKYRKQLEGWNTDVEECAAKLRADNKLVVHGGPNLMHVVASARKFIFRTGMPLQVHEFNEFTDPVGGRPTAQPSWTDKNLNVWALPISPSSPGSPSHSPASTGSGRKRSLDEFQETMSGAETCEGDSAYRKRARDQIARQAVISDMFNSDWRLDSLVETPLNEVQMPAKIFVRNPETHKIELYDGPKPNSGAELPDIKVLVRKPWPASLTQTLPPATPSDVSMSYIVQHHDVRGKFDVEKALALGVEKGRKFSDLTHGQSVENKDGEIITPEMVLGKPQPGGGLAFMDLPTVDYVENLVNRPEWTTPEVMKGLRTFIWVLGPGVGSCPLLKEFVLKMSEQKHIVSSPDYCPDYLAYQTGCEETVRFSVMDSERYAVPHHDNKTLPQKSFLTPDSEKREVGEEKLLFEPATAGMQLEMQPKFLVNKENALRPIDVDKTKKGIYSSALRMSAGVKEQINTPEFQATLASIRKDLPKQDAEIISLGTGSATPAKHRNVSSTLLKVPGVGNYLFDCGENTLGQLQRVFSPEELREVLRDLRVIWISHLHCDHQLGTTSVIRAWYKVVYGDDSPAPAPEPEQDLSKVLAEKRLFIVSNDKMLEWLAEYSSVEDFGFDKLVLLATHQNALHKVNYRHFGKDRLPLLSAAGNPKITTINFNDIYSPLVQQLTAATGLSDILSVPVVHCKDSNAVSLVFPSGLKVSYSGDCRPSKYFANVGRNSTVLIHEATFEDDMVGDAKAKRHSTVSEALDVAKRMDAKNVILTHFSQRYANKPTVPSIQALESFHAPSDSPARTQSPSGADAAAARAAKLEARRASNPPDVPLSDSGSEAASSGAEDAAEDDVVMANTSDALEQEKQKDAHVHVPVIVAFDMMRVRIGDMLCAERYYSVIDEYYARKERNELAAEEKRRIVHEQEMEAKKKSRMKGGGKGDGKAKWGDRAKGKGNEKGKGGDGNLTKPSENERLRSVSRDRAGPRHGSPVAASGEAGEEMQKRAAGMGGRC
ncbi:hypothetical protein AJ79_09648 [Helicocarpus griseus UAMH5409]|uniref:ribonuclease Z n=1 Tax=Helicocarpus griseus UAMH5409 TaxID=1447875 RepID=A0A2B7WI33_9EURO|nr:hypothetical protein AJ79_09648 [Helicocarpus griseus UAMH5409]